MSFKYGTAFKRGRVFQFRINKPPKVHFPAHNRSLVCIYTLEFDLLREIDEKHLIELAKDHVITLIETNINKAMFSINSPCEITFTISNDEINIT